ncbi:diguanylate cyclase [Desulfallas thermosapovorans]
MREHIEHMEINGFKEKIKVTVSIGVAAASSKQGIDIHQLINKADMAMYCAKNNGRNRVCQWNQGESSG